MINIDVQNIWIDVSTLADLKKRTPRAIRLSLPKSNYIYMCAKEDFSGTHNFAANYAEHMANARKYWQALNQRNIYK